MTCATGEFFGSGFAGVVTGSFFFCTVFPLVLSCSSGVPFLSSFSSMVVFSGCGGGGVGIKPWVASSFFAISHSVARSFLPCVRLVSQVK